jgi:hypothetical protein
MSSDCFLDGLSFFILMSGRLSSLLIPSEVIMKGPKVGGVSHCVRSFNAPPKDTACPVTESQTCKDKFPN